MSLKSLLRTALIALLGAAYLWLGHIGSIAAHPPTLSLIVGVLPLLAGAAVLAWHTRPRWLWLTLWGTAVAAMVYFVELFRQNTAWVFFAQHAGTHALLGLTFGRTLFGDPRSAFCSQIARFAHGELSPAMARYTWRVTQAWTLYFFAMTSLSLLLFALAPMAVWSVFANLLTAPLLGLMFVAEYLVRRRALPNDHHIGIAGTIRAFRAYSQERDQAKRTKP